VDRLQIENSLSAENRQVIQKLKSSLSSEPARETTLEGITKSAVTIVLKPKSNLEILLLKRKERDGDPWSGHMAFPGGRFDAKDHGIFETAVREAKEETGIDLSTCELLGRLDEVIPSSIRSITVMPYVFLAPQTVEVILDHKEIEEAYWVPLPYLVDKNNVRNVNTRIHGNGIEVPAYKLLGGQIVWGLTFRIIQSLIHRTGLAP
jgi:8-oxo-dGTP pyrophosphatase MutT (NUDIX family)